MSASYPTSSATDAKLSVAVNSLQTTLATGVNSIVTSIVLASSTGFPTAGYVTIDSEVIQYTGISVATLTGCTRGADGTTAAAHSTGVPVSGTIVADHHNSLRLEVQAIETDLVSAQQGAGTVAANIALKAPLASPVFTGTPSLPNINGTFIGLGRNRIVNGDCLFDQNKEGGVYTVGVAAHYTLDQWRCEATGTPNFTVQQSSTAPAGFQKSILFTTNTSGSPSSGDGCNIEQSIEGPYARDWQYGTAGAVTLTMSFWARASITGAYSISFLNSGANRAYVSTYTINVANTWEFKTITFTGDVTGSWSTALGDWGMKVVWDAGSGSSVTTSSINQWIAGGHWKATGSVSLVANAGATLYITGAQLEIGSIATAFEYTPYLIALRYVQRYVWKTFPQGTPCAAVAGLRGAIGYRIQQPGLTTGGSVMISLPVEMNPQGSAAVTFFSPVVPGSTLWYNLNQSLVSGTPSVTTIDSRTNLVIENPQVAGDAGGDVVYVHLLLQSQIGGA